METRFGSWELSVKFKVPHRNLLKAIRSCLDNLAGVDLVYEAKDESKRRARRIQEYLLTPNQWFQVTLHLRNTENQVKLKIYICNKILI